MEAFFVGAYIQHAQTEKAYKVNVWLFTIKQKFPLLDEFVTFPCKLLLSVSFRH